MTLVRWEPWRELGTLSNAMDRLFDERYFRPYRWNEETQVRVPLDVYEENDGYVAEVTIPGVKAGDVDVQVNGDTVTVSGTLSTGGDEKRHYLLRERAGGKFSRSLTLPVELDSEKVEATFAEGVLRLVLPKAAQFQPKKIAIKSA